MKIASVFLLVAVVLGLAAALLYKGLQPSEHRAGLNNSTSVSESPAIRAGYLPIIASLPLFVAVEQGYFEKRGVKVELTRFENSSHVSSAIVSGAIDVTASIAASSVFAIESRDPGKIRTFLVDAYTVEHPISGFVALKDSQISSIADLRGKRVGTFPGPNARIVNDIIFRNHKLDPKSDVNLIELAPELQIQALVSGQVDALRTTEPIPTQAVGSHNAINFYPGVIEKEVMSPFPGGVSIISAEFLGKHPDTADEYISAIYEAVHFIRQDPEQSNMTLVKYAGIDSQVARAVPTPGFLTTAESKGEELDKFAELAVAGGLIEKPVQLAKTFIIPKSK